MLVTILRVVLQRPLGLLKALRPALSGLERLAGRRTRSQQRLPPEPKASGCCPKLDLAECLFDVDHHPAAPRCENIGVRTIRATRVVTGAVIGAIGLLAIAAPAHADQPPIYSYSFTGAGANTLGGATGIAADNSGGPSANDLYIADYPNARIEKFDSSGNFILMFGGDVDQTTGGTSAPLRQGTSANRAAQHRPPAETQGRSASPSSLPWTTQTAPLQAMSTWQIGKPFRFLSSTLKLEFRLFTQRRMLTVSGLV